MHVRRGAPMLCEKSRSMPKQLPHELIALRRKYRLRRMLTWIGAWRIILNFVVSKRGLCAASMRRARMWWSGAVVTTWFEMNFARGWRRTERRSEDEPQIGRMAEFLTQTW
jgi:hypothetical protein